MSTKIRPLNKLKEPIRVFELTEGFTHRVLIITLFPGYHYNTTKIKVGNHPYVIFSYYGGLFLVQETPEQIFEIAEREVSKV